MKTILAFVVAAACSALLITSANAGGGRRQGLGLSSSATSTSSTSNGRSPLGEPVFLVPSTAPSTQSLRASGGREVIERASIGREARNVVEKSAISNETAKSAISSGTSKSTNVIFTPPPTIVGTQAGAAATGNVAGNNLAEQPFGSSILNTGLGSHTSSPAPDVQQVSANQGGFLPSVVPVGRGPQGPPTLDQVSATVTTQKPGAIVELPTTAAPKATTAVTAASGH